MLPRILSSSKFQTAFLSCVAAALLAASNGQLNEAQVNHIIDLFLTYVVPTALAATGLEDAARKFGVNTDPNKPPQKPSEFQQL